MSNLRFEVTHSVAMLFALGGLLPHVFFEVSHLLRKPMPPRIDTRYFTVRRALSAADGTVGYVSDEDIKLPAGAKLLTDAQYALSPHLLIAGGDAHYVIVNLSKPLLFDAFCRERGLDPIEAPWAGVALTVKKRSK